MKTLIKPYLLAAFTASFLFLSSCDKNSNPDPCDNIACNSGICSDGTCICDQYFEGSNCDIQFRDKFLGTWAGSAVCGSSGNSSSVRYIAIGNICNADKVA